MQTIQWAGCPTFLFRIASGGLWYWYRPASLFHFLILGYSGVVIGLTQADMEYI